METISGVVEVTVAVAEGQSNVNLHAQGLNIESVQLGELSLAWGYKSPTVNPLPEDWKKHKVKDTAADLAKLAFLQYKHIRECAVHPNLCIKVPVIGGEDRSKEITLTIKYSVVRPTGFCFVDGYGYRSTGLLNGVATWMPCNETNAKHTMFNFEISVSVSEVVICSGKLTKTELNSTQTRKIYHYEVSTLMCLSRLFVGIGHFEVFSCPMPTSLQDSSTSTFVSCFGAKNSVDAMVYTMKLFPFVFSFIEETLDTQFPFESLKILFLPDVSPIATGWHDCIVYSPSILLTDKRYLDHGLHHRFQLCLGLARVWFGAIVLAKTPVDDWLLEGIVGWLERKLISRIIGMNELRYRRAKEQRLLSEADDGTLPPLYPRDGVACLHGTEWIHCNELFRWKSTAVMTMIEHRVSLEAFKRVIERLLACAVDAIKAGSPSSKRLISTRSFLKEVGQAGGIKREIQAIAERWVYGRGCPTISTEVDFDPKSFSLLLKMRQILTPQCEKATSKAVMMSKDGSIGLVKVEVSESTSIASYTVQLGASAEREARFKLHGRPRKRRRTEAVTTTFTEKSNPVKWVRVNSNNALLANVQTKQTEEMWSTMLEEARDVLAESEAIHGLLSLDSGALSICRTLEAFIKSNAYCRVRMEAILALAKLTGRENSYEGLHFLVQFYRSRCFDLETSLPKANCFVDLAEYLIDQTVAVALGGMRDEDGFTPREAVEVILNVLEYNDNEGNEFDDSDWLASWFLGLQKVVVKDSEEWKPIFKVLERYLNRDKLFPSRNEILTQSCLTTLSAASLHQSVSPRLKILHSVAEYVNPQFHNSKTRAVAGECVTQITSSIYGPDTAILNTLSWLIEEESIVVRETLFRYMLSLINLLGAKARGKDGIGWKTVSLLYNLMVDSQLDGQFRHYCLLIILSICDEPLNLHREQSDWILKTEN
eukprot:g9068.t1